MNKLTNKVYNKRITKTDPRVCLKIPQDVYDELLGHADKNGRNRNDEIISRLIISLQFNQEFMARDHLMRLIYSKKLAYKERSNKKD